MALITAANIEARFSTESGKAEFPAFCNSVIALEAPWTSSFPKLSSMPGADGGIDGEWDLSAEAALPSSAFTRNGWNIYQFKAVDVASLGRDKAFRELCRRAKGAIAELVDRLTIPAVPRLYVLFTNFQLGIATGSRTKQGASLNQKHTKLHAALLAEAPAGIEVEIVDSGMFEGFVARHRALRLMWFGEKAGTSWAEAHRRELNLWQIDVAFLGREAEFKQIEAWLADDTVRVIALSGPNSIGKTRLALEATRAVASVTVFADDTSALIHDDLASLASGTRPVVVVVEDPQHVDAVRLVRQALGSERPLKLLLTMPAERQIPAPIFGDTKRVQVRHLAALNSEDARKLLDSANPRLDHRARDWVLLQAGGNPGIIIAAARHGEKLRASADSLRDQLTREFRQRLESKLDREAVLIASVLSPLVDVRSSDAGEVSGLLTAIAPELPQSTLLRRLGELASFGFLRRRGDYVAVVPPMFAAGLLRELIAARADLPASLFAALNHGARKRLLERLVTLDLPDHAPCWRMLIDAPHSHATSAELNDHLEILEYLARAAPRVVATFLNRELDSLAQLAESSGDPKALGRIRAVVAELVDDSDTGSLGFKMSMRLAIREARSGEQKGAADVVRECFVFWFPRPFTYREREAVVEQLLASPEVPLRLLAASVVVIATDPPRSLSGRAMQARRLGREPSYETLRECYDFLIRMMQRRLRLCHSEEHEIAKMARQNLPQAFSTLSQDLPAEHAMKIFREGAALHFSGKLLMDARDFCGQLRWIRDRYSQHRERAGQEKWKDDWGRIIAEIDGWIGQLMSGPFIGRLRLATGRNFEFEKITFENREIYEFELRVITLAREAAAEPALMTDAAWDLLVVDGSQNTYEFARELGAADREHRHYAALWDRAETWQWARLLSAYLHGAQQSDAAWAEAQLAGMPLSRGESNLAALLSLVSIGPTPANRIRLQALLVQRAVRPRDVATTFSAGRWLETLPSSEVRAIFEYIESGADNTLWLVDVIALYLFSDKALPRDLFPVAHRALAAVGNGRSGNVHDANQVAIGIARTDIEAGLELLRDAVVRLSDAQPWTYQGWNPFHSYESRDFWEFVREREPHHAYAILGNFRRPHRWPDFRGHGDRHLLDLEKHTELLLAITAGDENAAHVFADCVVSTQHGFFPFAIALVEQHPDDSELQAGLSSAITERTGFGSCFNHLGEAHATVERQLESPDLSHAAKKWLESLGQFINDRRQEERRYLDSEPPFWD